VSTSGTNRGGRASCGRTAGNASRGVAALYDIRLGSFPVTLLPTRTGAARRHRATVGAIAGGPTPGTGTPGVMAAPSWSRRSGPGARAGTAALLEDVLVFREAVEAAPPKRPPRHRRDLAGLASTTPARRARLPLGGLPLHLASRGVRNPRCCSTRSPKYAYGSTNFSTRSVAATEH